MYLLYNLEGTCFLHWQSRLKLKSAELLARAIETASMFFPTSDPVIHGLSDMNSHKGPERRKGRCRRSRPKKFEKDGTRSADSHWDDCLALLNHVAFLAHGA